VQRVLEEIRRSQESTAEQLSREQRPLPEEPRRLSLEKVSFRYQPELPEAVHGVSLSIDFGSTVSFVGASGAGKSTMVDLLLGLLEPTEGTVAIDGIPLGEVSRAWRSRVAYVPQDVSLFDSSVAQNVALTWTDDFDPDRVRRALEQAQLLEIVE